MERRSFLKYTAICSATLALGSGSYFAFSSFYALVYDMVSTDTAHLKLQKDSIHKFIQEAKEKNFFAQFDTIKRYALRADMLVGNHITLNSHDKIKQARAKIVGQFLLSTDFFINKMDESKEISYRWFYDPYLAPCSNPFTSMK